MQFVPEFKIANTVIHVEEQSLYPHMHIVGIPVKDGYKNGMRKYYEVDYKLKEKEIGRNFDIPVNKISKVL